MSQIEILPQEEDNYDKMLKEIVNSPQGSSKCVIQEGESPFASNNSIPADTLDGRQHYLNHILNEDVRKARNEHITAEDILEEVSNE